MKDELFTKLQSHCRLTDDECFDIASEISQMLNSTDSNLKQCGRNLIIRLLDNWINVPDSYKTILTDLVSAAGFYPYLKNIDNREFDFSDEIRVEFHKSSYLSDKYFHVEQKKIADLINQKVNVIVSAPTSFGKSMLIEEVVASCTYKNIVIIQPTLALLDETRRKLKKYTDNYKIIVKTSQSYSIDKGNIFLLTAERVLEYLDMPKIDLLILDEFYKLSNNRGDNRNNILNTAFIRIMKNPDCKFYMLGPNIDSIPLGFTEKYNAVFYKTDFSMVLTDADDRFKQVHKKRGGKIVESDLFAILDDLKEQTLIYCSSPKTARALAFSYCEHVSSKNVINPTVLPLVQWINDNLSCRWSLAKCLQYKIAVHDGALPKHITSSTINYFNHQRITYLFCTNTIIEGVNTSAKNVIYYDDKIGTKDIDYFDYSNIRGRAGRLMEHYVGTIINLKKPPEKKETDIDFPFFNQDPISSEVLVNLNENEVKDINDNIKRFQEFRKKDQELQEILKRNAVTIEGQEKILQTLFKDLSVPEKRELIIWSSIDKNLYKRLEYLFDLCWENLSTEEERKSFGGSKGWIVNKIVGSCFQKSINEMINDALDYSAHAISKENKVPYHSVDDTFLQFPTEMQKIVDNLIERFFSLQKNWLQYRAPKWINVVDSLQKYATNKLQMPSGDYSYVAEMIENEFIQSNFRILLEFGIPKSAIQKIQLAFELNRISTRDMKEDDVLVLISKKRTLINRYLSEYESEILNRAI